MSTPPRPGPGRPIATPGVTELSAPAGAMLAATVGVLCRDDRLSVSEIGDHIDLVAEIADAMGALSDRLARDLTARDLTAGDGTAGDGAADDQGLAAVSGILDRLRTMRDDLSTASSTARRCADQLYRAHVEPTPPQEP